MYEPVSMSNIHLGDVVRRVGRPMVIGYVVGLEDENLLIRWSLNGPIDKRHHMTLQRRLDGAEIRVNY